LTELRFADLPIHADTKRAFAEILKYEHATKVQSESLPPCLAGSDVLAKAKTGTGKTLAFLVPVLEMLVSIPLAERSGHISALIMSPTRELAQQIEAEAKHLCTFHTRSGLVKGTLVIVGGQKISKDLKILKGRNLPDILVATPGRLKDHLENHGLQEKTSRLRMLVFDEADQVSIRTVNAKKMARRVG
jgi:ATP-dependent RNA helicase MSS116